MILSTRLKLAILPLFAVLALGSSSSKKGDSDDKGASTSTTSAGVGKALTIGDSEWTVLDVADRGQSMKPNESWDKEATTTGRFIQVHMKIANVGKKEGTLAGGPKLVDPAGGREFGTFETQSSYLPKDATGVFLDKIQPSMSKEFYEIYEIPAGITKLSLKAMDFGLFGTEKTIDLGIIPAAPPAPAAKAAAAPAVKAAAPAAKPAANAKTAPNAKPAK